MPISNAALMESFNVGPLMPAHWILRSLVFEVFARLPKSGGRDGNMEWDPMLNQQMNHKDDGDADLLCLGSGCLHGEVMQVNDRS